MLNQPTPAPTTPTPAPSVSNAAAVCLAVSAVSAASLAGLAVVDMVTPIDPAIGLANLLAAVCAVFGVAYVNRSREDRISQRQADACRLILERIDQLERRMDEHAAGLAEQGEQNFASAFVAGAAGGRHLTAVPRQG